MSYTFTIEPHRESWKGEFAREAGLVQGALRGVLRAVHHIGSTAVPGLQAKPVIDLLAEVESVEAVDGCKGAMERLGYEALGEFGLGGRRYFRKDSAAGLRTHQVHAFASGSAEIVRHLAFRDYLRYHPVVAAEYGALKLRLLETCGGEIEAYILGKDAFVKDVERQALAWLARERR